MNFMVSHYDYEKQHNQQQFNLLNVIQCTKSSNMPMLRPESMSEQKQNVLKLLNEKRTLKKKDRFVLKAPLKLDVLMELFGTITQSHFLLLLIFLIVKTLLETSMVSIKSIEKF